MDQPQSLPSNSNNVQGSTSHNSENTNFQPYAPLCKALRVGDLDAVTKFFTSHAVTASINSSGSTALHVAVMFRHFHIIEMLLQLMSSEDLEVVTVDGHTALHYAAKNGNDIKVAKWLVEKNEKLVSITSSECWIPLTLAIELGNIEMTYYLYSVTPLEVLLPENSVHGTRLLTRCYYSKLFDVALDLLKCCPRLAVAPRIWDTPFLNILATTPLAILEESQITYWQRWLYKFYTFAEGVHVHQEPASSIKETVVRILETNTKKDDYMMCTGPGLLHQLVSNTLKLLGIKHLQEAKLAHKQYIEILHAACNEISTLNIEEMEDRGVYLSVLQAAKYGNAEFIVEAVKAAFELLWTEISEEKCIFHLAVKFRQAKVFDLIHGVIQKEVFLNYIDQKRNNLLHMAGTLAPFSYLNQIPGAALQMQRELQWFKEVESIMPPMQKKWTNMDGIAPRELFTNNHKDLVKQAEKWMKGIASSCTVVAALVATITFAAAFTVPGGNDQDKGYPILSYKKLFMLFIISDAVSLFSSTTSLLMFLGLLTTRYAEDDFLISLPTKLMIGLSTMFISLATMVVTFSATLLLLLQNKTWIAIPVSLLACIPVILYIWLQFPLLVGVFMSTYRPRIFEKNVKPWP